jgi:hypothetical protein
MHSLECILRRIKKVARSSWDNNLFFIAPMNAFRQGLHLSLDILRLTDLGVLIFGLRNVLEQLSIVLCRYDSMTASFVLSVTGMGSIPARLLTGVTTNERKVDTITFFFSIFALAALTTLLVPLTVHSVLAQVDHRLRDIRNARLWHVAQY